MSPLYSSSRDNSTSADTRHEIPLRHGAPSARPSSQPTIRKGDEGSSFPYTHTHRRGGFQSGGGYTVYTISFAHSPNSTTQKRRKENHFPNTTTTVTHGLPPLVLLLDTVLSPDGLPASRCKYMFPNFYPITCILSLAPRRRVSVTDHGVRPQYEDYLPPTGVLVADATYK